MIAPNKCLRGIGGISPVDLSVSGDLTKGSPYTLKLVTTVPNSQVAVTIVKAGQVWRDKEKLGVTDGNGVFVWNGVFDVVGLWEFSAHVVVSSGGNDIPLSDEGEVSKTVIDIGSTVGTPVDSSGVESPSLLNGSIQIMGYQIPMMALIGVAGIGLLLAVSGDDTTYHKRYGRG